MKEILEILTVGPFQCNCVILGDPETKEAIVIDPGDQVSRIMEKVAKHGLKVRTIVHTHTHIDHIGATAELQKATNARVCLHKEDLPLYENMAMQAQFLGIPLKGSMVAVGVDEYLTDGYALKAGGLEGVTLHTPGHTPGSCAFYFPSIRGEIPLSPRTPHLVDNLNDRSLRLPGRDEPDPVNPHSLYEGILIAGDTLFAGSIGRTDLWKGDYDQEITSIKKKLLSLGDAVVVVPGHGPKTTIGFERQNNPFLI